jgi:hypothetical protein
MIRTSFPILAFAGLTLVAGLLHGQHTGRWAPSADLADAVDRLNAVPLSVGDWRGTAEPLDADDLRGSGIKGHVSARFRNVATGDKVSMLLVCGRPGPISVHTPETCYGGAGFQAAAPRYRKELSAGAVWAMSFRAPPTSAASMIEVNWVWNGGDGWLAPANSRWSLSGYPALYKLYVVRDLPAAAARPPRDASADFLQAYLPELEKVLSRGQPR